MNRINLKTLRIILFILLAAYLGIIYFFNLNPRQSNYLTAGLISMFFLFLIYNIISMNGKNSKAGLYLVNNKYLLLNLCAGLFLLYSIYFLLRK